jgi:Fe-S-cluster-containing hydrogenase component 2
MHLRELAVQDSLSLMTWNIGQKTVAVKCDLCYFSENGPACVIACPHKALSIIDEETGQPISFAEQIKAVAVSNEGQL